MHPALRARCPDLQSGKPLKEAWGRFLRNEHLAGNCGIIGTNNNQVRTDAGSLRLDVDTRGCDVEDCIDRILQLSQAHNAE